MTLKKLCRAEMENCSLVLGRGFILIFECDRNPPSKNAVMRESIGD